MGRVKLGDTVAYDETIVDYHLIPQNFRSFVGKLVLMDDDAIGVEEPSWLEVVQIERLNSNGDLTIYTVEGCHETIKKHKLVRHSGNYVALYAIKPEVLNAPEEEEPEEKQETAVIVSEEYTKAVTLTRHIIANAQAMQASLYEVCKGLKEMRDGKLYKELGYQNFEDYCENEVGIKRRQGYTYLKIAESLTEEFVQSTAQIGVQKLALLAKLDEPEREEVLQKVDPNETSVKELKAQIKQLKAEKMELVEHHTQEQGDFLRKVDQLQGRVQELEEARRSKHQEWLNAMDEITALAVQKTKLEEQVQELESRPVDMHSEKDVQEIKQLKEELKEVTEERDLKERARLMLLHKWQESSEKAEALQKELDKLKAKPPETVTVEDTTRIKKLEGEIADLKQQLAEKPAVQESLSSNNDEFDAYLKLFDDALKHMTCHLFRQSTFAKRQSVTLLKKKFESYILALEEQTND